MDARERREAYERDGWVLVPRLVGARKVRALDLAAQDLVKAAAHLERDATIRGARYHVQSASGRGGEAAISPGTFRKITFAAALGPAFARLITDARIAAVVASIGLPSARCVVDQVNLKAARVGTGFPWHQDARFLTSRQQEMVARDGGVNLVVAIDRSDAGNGGFEVLSGTHLGGPVEFDYDTSGTNAGLFDESGRTLVPLDPGDAVLFHPYLAHGSGPNHSDAPRRLFAMWFIGRGAPDARRPAAASPAG
ncbi:MAG: phytanoyl-CoA dioxygenase family protein [Acidobacteriota bacterium]